jgi:hypothetical protein
MSDHKDYHPVGDTETARQVRRLNELRRPFTPPLTPAESKMVVAVQEKLARTKHMLEREAARRRQ